MTDKTNTKLNLRTKKRIVKDLINIGKKRIKFTPENLEEIKSALTKKDIKSLIKKGVIKIKQKKKSSRSRIRKNIIQKRKGRRKGQGSKKGKESARLNSKKKWMHAIRAQRNLLKELRNKNLITAHVYRKMYLKAKGGFFRSKRHILTYLTEHKLIQKKK
ncbi:MAG: 50S ribosomal protein L19e [Nanoarchaeota archaeon]|nr:50S ribosomal protein L19e [Nanoarchaeota archaeon]